MRSSTRAGSFLELPPRTRRILAGEAQRRTNQGTTSAYAENTPCGGGGADFPRNYLRVRGEYSGTAPERRPMMELPPRTRRIRI